jgi:quercetin dioxygenase-like cupin family protein
MFITRGSCVMLGERVDEGSYVYVPPGVAHAVDDVGPDGVEFFYTDRPVEVSAPHDDDDFVASPV